MFHIYINYYINSFASVLSTILSGECGVGSGDVLGLKRCISKKLSDLTIYYNNI